jgi:ABC-type amino acid transport substrate-binding protein
MAAKNKLGFETSSRLKELFNQHFEVWRKKHSADLSDLAYKCGVSPAYLGHIRRYGRIPGRPVLILLAFNFKVSGQKLFEAASIHDNFPYADGLEITKPSQEENSLFSIKLNADALTDAIKAALRNEIKSRTAQELLGSRPLRIGLNYHMWWLFGSHNPPANAEHIGIFADVCRMLGTALQTEIELKHVPFSAYLDQMSKGQIDLFGPTMIAPNLPINVSFSNPLHSLGISALWRRKACPGLKNIQTPTSLDDLNNNDIKIAVTKNTLPHLVTNTRLNKNDTDLILCSSDEEGIERVTMKGLQRPAHIFITNSMTAYLTEKEHKTGLQLLFDSKETLIDLAETSFAIRPDWPEFAPQLNHALNFLLTRGGVSERLRKVFKGTTAEFVEFID